VSDNIKTIIYAAVMTLTLYDQGLINIDDAIANHLTLDLTDKIPNGNTALIKQLMNHSSGIPEHENSIKLTWEAFHNPALERKSDIEFLDYIFNKDPLFPAGEKTAYSTSGIIIEDLVLESITGKPHADLFDDLIVNKLGLTNTHFSNSTGYPLIEDRVDMYWDIYSNNNLINSNQYSDGIDHDFQFYLGASKVLFTAFDLFLFSKALFEDDLLLTSETLELMKTIKYNENNSNDGYGLGLEIKHDPIWGKRFGHQGASIGVKNNVYWYDANGGIIVLLTNIAGFGDSPAGNSISGNTFAEDETLLGEFEKILLE